MLRTLVTILALARAAEATSCSGSGSIDVSSSCSEYNCFDGAHIMGWDITCDTGFTEAQCAEKCCGQYNCKGFDYSATDHGMGAGRCCTSLTSRYLAGGAFEQNGGTYRNCEKNSVTCADAPPPGSPSPTDSSVECWIDVITESHNGNDCFKEKCPPFHTKGGKWCKLHTMAGEKVCCGADCCEPNAGAIAGAIIGAVIGVTLIIVLSCYCGRCGCFRYRRDQLIAAATATQQPQQPQVVYVQPAAPAQVVASV